MTGGLVYILCNRHNGATYIGVTADLARRAWEHREGIGSEFCQEHGITRLVHVEQFATIVEAIAREKALKRWKRDWKIRLIEESNPDWRDLWFDLNK
jgi:putative endonuclease